MSKRKFIGAFVLSICLVMSSSAIGFAASYGGVDEALLSKGIIRATGWGLGPKDTDIKSSFYKTYARQAAKLDALRQLAEICYGVTVNIENPSNGSSKNEVVKTRVPHENILLIAEKARQVGEAKFFQAGTCEVAMEGSFFELNGVVIDEIKPSVTSVD